MLLLQWIFIRIKFLVHCKSSSFLPMSIFPLVTQTTTRATTKQQPCRTAYIVKSLDFSCITILAFAQVQENHYTSNWIRFRFRFHFSSVQFNLLCSSKALDLTHFNFISFLTIWFVSPWTGVLLHFLLLLFIFPFNSITLSPSLFLSLPLYWLAHWRFK